MTDDERRDHDVRTWIQSESPDHAPDRLRHAIRSELVQTRQERGRAGLIRASWLRSPARTALAAVLVLALGLIAGGLLGNGSLIADRRPTPTPPSSASSPSPTVSSSPVPTPSGIVLSSGFTTTDVFTPTLRFAVPAGWIQVYDQPSVFHISPPTAGYLRQTDGQVYFDGITAYSRPVAGPPDGGPSTVAGVGTTAKDLATWLSTRPQLLASKPKLTTLAGRPAYQLDFTLSPDAGELCGVPCVNLLNSTDRVNWYQFGIEGPWKVRSFLLDGPNGATVMITVEDVDGVGFDSEVRAAQPVLDSLSFGG
jgi:hypothetical protein